MIANQQATHSANGYLALFGIILISSFFVLWRILGILDDDPRSAQDTKTPPPTDTTPTVARANTTPLDSVGVRVETTPKASCVEPLQKLAQATAISFPGNAQRPDAPGLNHARQVMQGVALCDTAVVVVQGHVGHHRQETVNLKESWGLADVIIAQMAHEGFDVARVHPVGFGSRDAQFNHSMGRHVRISIIPRRLKDLETVQFQ